MAEGPWFFCLKHHTVEPRDGCAERHRLGPYETREEAEHALQSVAERERAARPRRTASGTATDASPLSRPRDGPVARLGDDRSGPGRSGPVEGAS